MWPKPKFFIFIIMVQWSNQHDRCTITSLLLFGDPHHNSSSTNILHSSTPEFPHEYQQPIANNFRVQSKRQRKLECWNLLHFLFVKHHSDSYPIQLWFSPLLAFLILHSAIFTPDLLLLFHFNSFHSSIVCFFLSVKCALSINYSNYQILFFLPFLCNFLLPFQNFENINTFQYRISSVGCCIFFTFLVAYYLMNN
jgi:hypothetical protein